MVNHITVTPLALLGCFVANIAIGGAANAYYAEDTIRGASYSYVQPDNKSFAVWSLIYGLQLLTVVTQLVPGGDADERLAMARPWNALNLLSNSLWLVANGAANRGLSFWLSVLVLWVNLLAVFRAYQALGVDYTCRRTSLSTKLSHHLALSCNLAWVVVAAVLDLCNTAFDPRSESRLVVGGPDFAIAVVALATILAAYLAVTRADYGYVGVTIWAFAGIYRNQQETRDSPLEPCQELADCAQICIVIVGLALALGGVLSCCGAASEGSAPRCK